MAKGGTPETPDYGPAIKASKKTSKRALKLADKQFNWAKKQYKKNNAVTKDLVQDLSGAVKFQLENAKEDRARYEEVFIPVQDRYIAEAGELYGKADAFSAEVAQLKQQAIDYGGEANKGRMVGRATADVAQGFDTARKAALRELEGFGLNPSATRYGALDIGVRTAEAAAKAAAATNAAIDVEDRSREMYEGALDRELQARGLDMAALEADLNAVKIGEGQAAQITNQVNSATGAVGTAAGAQAETLNSGTAARTSAATYMGASNAAVANMTNALGAQFNNELSAYQAEQEASSGFGSILGSVAGLATSFLEEGGAVGDPGINATSHGPVPVTASPTSGGAVDDVPARLTVGEFVIPKNVVEHKGTEFFQRLIANSTKAMGGQPKEAKADVRMMPPQAPSYVSPSRQNAGALPLG